MHKQDKTNREIGLEDIMESMYSEARPYIDWSKHGGDKVKDEKCSKCGEVHPINASCGVAHEADVKESDGEWATNIAAMRKEIDEFLTTSVHTTGAEDLKAYVLAIIDRYLGTGPIKRMHGKDNQAL